MTFFCGSFRNLRSFPRSQKFLIANRIEAVLLDVLDLVIEAAYSKKKSTPHIKKPELFISVFTFYSGLIYDVSILGSPYKAMQVWKYRPLLLCKHLIFRHVLPEAMMCNLLKLFPSTVLQGLPALAGGTKMNILEIERMSMIDRLQAMEALWDSFKGEKSEIDSPEWHRDILEKRKRKIKNGKAEFISLEELRASRKS